MAKKQAKGTFTASMQTMSFNSSTSKCGIGVKVPGHAGSLDELDKLLNGAQLKVDCKVQPNADADIDDQSGTQATMPGTETTLTFKGTGECNGFSRLGDNVSFRLTFNGTAVDESSLKDISGQHVSMKLTRIGDAEPESDE